MIRGDDHRVRQILANLLSNAIRFTDCGEVMVTVTGEDRGGRRYIVFFKVEDTGIGIASDRLDRLFNTYPQETASTSRRFGGRGWDWQSPRSSPR
jgi:signal transduction histidine kinase